MKMTEKINNVKEDKKKKDLLTEDPDFGWEKKEQKSKGLNKIKLGNEKKNTAKNLKTSYLKLNNLN